jgi:hypothetical protein
MNTRSRFILIKDREEYLVKSYEIKNGYHLETVPSIFDATAFRSKKAIAILENLKSRNIDAMIINVTEKRKIYYFELREGESLNIKNIVVSYDEVDIEDYLLYLSSISPKNITMGHRYYFKSSKELYKFLYENKKAIYSCVNSYLSKFTSELDNNYKILENTNSIYRQVVRSSKLTTIIEKSEKNEN